MARITVEDCLTKETNRFALVQLAARRTKQILNGARVLIPDSKGNKAVVTSLREIADGMVAFMSEEELSKLREKEQREREERAAAEEAKRAETVAAKTETSVSSALPEAAKAEQPAL